MMNLAPNDMPAPIGRVQEVPLGQEILQCPAARKKSLANGAIPALKRSRQSSAMRPLALVLNPSSPFCAAHSGSKIRQVEPRARDWRPQPGTRVETEKPHPGVSPVPHLGAHISFGKYLE